MGRGRDGLHREQRDERSRTSRLRLSLVLAAAACNPESRRDAEPVLLREVAAEVGITFEHSVGGRGRFDFPEITSGGVAVIDFDRDGDLDVWIGGSGRLAADAADAPHGRLYRNDMVPNDPTTLRFVDVTKQAGISPRCYEVGAAVGDANADGYDDLYLTCVGPNELWMNQGDGTFAEAGTSAGVAAPGWSASAGFADFDRDGVMDLAVVDYVDWRAESDKPCRGADGQLDYCGPLSFEPTADHLYYGRGDGTFEEGAARMGLLEAASNGLALAIEDFDADGWLDLYVASDQLPNLLWSRRGAREGRFREAAHELGLAVNALGVAEASMGTAVADFDGDGDLDMIVTHLTGETTTLYAQVGNGAFADATARSGIGQPTRTTTGFGIGALDLEGDGDLDVVIANGAVLRKDGLARGQGDFPYQQPDVVLRNEGDGRFVDISREAGPYFAELRVGRGLAVADLDNDGAADIVIANANGVPAVLLNQAGRNRSWFGLQLREAADSADAEGVHVEVELDDGRVLRRVGRSSGSFASAHDRRVLVNLGSAAAVGMSITWPDGTREQHSVPPLQRWTVVLRGETKR